MSRKKRTLNRNINNKIQLPFCVGDGKYSNNNYLTVECGNTPLSPIQDNPDPFSVNSTDTVTTLEYFNELNLHDSKESNESSNNDSDSTWIDEFEAKISKVTLPQHDDIERQITEIDSYLRGKRSLKQHQQYNENHYSNHKTILDEWKLFFPNIKFLGYQSLLPRVKKKEFQSVAIMNIKNKNESKSKPLLPPIEVNNRTATALTNSNQKFYKNNDRYSIKLPPIFHKDWR